MRKISRLEMPEITIVAMEDISTLTMQEEKISSLGKILVNLGMQENSRLGMQEISNLERE